MPYKALVERTIARSRTAVFAALMDFGAIARLAPAHIASCRVEGSGVGAIRRFTLTGSTEELAERLECAHDETVFSYSVVTPNSLGLDHYHAVVILTDAPGGACRVAWGSNWFSRITPEAEVAAMLADMYNALLDAIEKG